MPFIIPGAAARAPGLTIAPPGHPPPRPRRRTPHSRRRQTRCLRGLAGPPTRWRPPVRPRVADAYVARHPAATAFVVAPAGPRPRHQPPPRQSGPRAPSGQASLRPPVPRLQPSPRRSPLPDQSVRRAVVVPCARHAGWRCAGLFLSTRPAAAGALRLLNHPRCAEEGVVEESSASRTPDPDGAPRSRTWPDHRAPHVRLSRPAASGTNTEPGSGACLDDGRCAPERCFRTRAGHGRTGGTAFRFHFASGRAGPRIAVPGGAELVRRLLPPLPLRPGRLLRRSTPLGRRGRFH